MIALTTASSIVQTIHRAEIAISTVEKDVTQATKNVENLKAAYRAFNRNDLRAVAEYLAEDITYTDHARGITTTGRDELMELVRGWKEAFSDMRMENARFIDAGDTVVVISVGRGTNDGSFGPFPATGEQVDARACEVVRFNDAGQVTSGEVFYDQLTILTQLGHIEELAGG